MKTEKFLKDLCRPALIAVSFMTFFGANAYHVSTEPQAKHMLIEEATGMLCTNCPSVNPVVEKLEETYPDANIVAIHGYHFANKAFDLTTPEGDEIVDYFNIAGYPQAMIDRVLFDGMERRFMSEPFWHNFLKQESEVQAPVNLWMYSWLNEETGIVEIVVEGYCLEDLTDLEPSLNIVMTQNDIPGPQSGQKLPMYRHNHVVRKYITPTWGEELTKTGAGDYFKVIYEFELPEKISYYEVLPENLKFVAFVTEGKVNVMNSTSSVISYEKLEEEEPEDEEPTGIGSVIQEGTEIEAVYDINGRRVNEGTASLSPGIYIVKSGTSTRKVIVSGH